MRFVNKTSPFRGCTVLLILIWSMSWKGFGLPSDSAYLPGIHWYSSDTSDNDVENMSGNRGIWVVDQALLDSTATLAAPNPWETPWVTSPVVDKSEPWAKVGYTSAVVAKGHTPIIRLHPFWSVNVPFAGDPYSNQNFASDCRAAANLMTDVHIWQIGNEANLNGENRRWNVSTQKYDLPWSDSDLQQSPELYAQTYIACRNRIHEIVPLTESPEQIVLMQPCSPGNAESGTRFMGGDEYLARMIAAIEDKSQIDGFALHAYAEPGGPDYGADGFMSDIRRQIAIIDQAGLGDRPVFITEFNKHMPDETQANIAAQFITTAFSRLNIWNTGSAQLWPDSIGNHPIRGTSWFVYRNDGWDDYSLERWKNLVSSTSPLLNPWYSFQQACAQEYVAGAGSGPVLTSASTWWTDEFGSLDEDWPLPQWKAEAPAGSSVSAASGEVRIQSASSFKLAGIHQSDIAFSDFALEMEVSFANAAPVLPGEANMDIRIRQTGPGGPGYSLTLYPDGNAQRGGEAWLRKTSVWSEYKHENLSGGIGTGDAFKIQLIARESKLEIKILRMSTNAVVLDWTGSNAVEDSDFRVGGIGVFTYNLSDARIMQMQMGGPESLSTSRVGDWSIYD